MRVADFFCGGGGFSEGFRQAGFQIVFAVDKWEPAVNTYRGNKPGVNVIQDDVIRISKLPEDKFEALVPDTEVIIGSPPCQSFSHSNKSGNGDKTLGIQLIEAYLRIVARKKFKKNSILQYWVLENVPAVKNYIKEEYTAADLGLDGDFVLKPLCGASGKYNAKFFGAPTNRERFLCGEFPPLVETKQDNNVTTLEDGVSNAANRLSAIIRLRQAATNPALLNRGLDDYYDELDEPVNRMALDNTLNVSDEIMEIIRTYKNTEVPPKFIKAAEIAKGIIAEGGKLVIWCEFVGTCDDLSAYLKKSGIDNRILYGHTDYLEREQIINEFTDKNTPSSFNVVIANPHAVGESISLHATCHNALYLEQSFNAGTYMQSKDRIHRVGLHESDITRYYYIHSANTIDEVVFDRVNSKERKMIELLESQEIPLIADNQDFMEDNEDDIKAIIRGYYEFRSKHF